MAVKVPVVPGIGIIVVGIAKAEADIIYLTGFDGGTGVHITAGFSALAIVIGKRKDYGQTNIRCYR